MSNRPKQETIISFGQDIFRIDDLITIKTSGVQGKECKGRIVMIGSTEFTLDMSDKYRANDRRFVYEHVTSMVHIEE